MWYLLDKILIKTYVHYKVKMCQLRKARHRTMEIIVVWTYEHTVDKAGRDGLYYLIMYSTCTRWTNNTIFIRWLGGPYSGYNYLTCADDKRFKDGKQIQKISYGCCRFREYIQFLVISYLYDLLALEYFKHFSIILIYYITRFLIGSQWKNATECALMSSHLSTITWFFVQRRHGCIEPPRVVCVKHGFQTKVRL